MKYSPLSLFLIFAFLSLNSCNSHDTHPPKTDSLATNPNRTLAGQMYFFAPEYDSTHFVATGQCDCCSANAIFLDDSVCLYIDYCDEGCSYIRGIYHLQNGQLDIRFDSLTVDEIYNGTITGDSTGSTPPEVNYSTSATLNNKLTYKKQVYKGRILFTAPKEFGAVDTTESPIEKMKEIQTKGIWDRLIGKTKVVNPHSPAAAMPDVLGVWAGPADENASFVIKEGSIYYPDHFKEYKYKLEHDSIKIEYGDYEGAFAIKMNGTDTLILSGDERQVFYRFKKSIE
jgi:hypothetical protein